MKQCSVCNETKDLHEFDKRRLASGEQVATPRCKACRRAYIRQYDAKKRSKTGLTREEWLNSVRKPQLSPEERKQLGQAKWDAWYAEWKNSGAIEDARKEAEQEREARLAAGVNVCSSCKEELPLSQFSMRKRKRKDGSHYRTPDSGCKSCKNKSNTERRATPQGKAARKAYRESSAGKARAKRERAIRRRRSKQATPTWLTPEQKQQIVDIYEHMRDCRAVTGEEYHVDHIVPLRGEDICGLHVPWNLQVLPAYVNIAKSNSFWTPLCGLLEQVP